MASFGCGISLQHAFVFAEEELMARMQLQTCASGLSGPVTAPSGLHLIIIIVISRLELLEKLSTDRQRHVLEVAERVGQAQVVADANVPGELDTGTIPEGLDLVAVCERALDEDYLADVLRVAVLELDLVSASVVGHTVKGTLDFFGAEALALQPDLGTCSQSRSQPTEPQHWSSEERNTLLFSLQS